jgi:hypothetical protein
MTVLTETELLVLLGLLVACGVMVVLVLKTLRGGDSGHNG